MKIAPAIPALAGMVAVGLMIQSPVHTPGSKDPKRIGEIISPYRVSDGYDSQEYEASTSLLGQFRTSVSSWLWLRTDSYMHNGVELRQMTDQEKKAGTSSESPVNDGEQQIRKEDAVLTTIPSPDRDFRGIFGDIERATSAYKDMHNHKHNNPEVALPLFRLMTWIDPNFVPGWVDGAAVISRDHSLDATYKALNYLQEGREQAPHSIDVVMEMGELCITRLHNLSKALGYLEAARELGKDAQNLLDPTESDALEQDYRWLCLSYRDLGQNQKMRAAAIEGLKKYPDDGVLMHLLVPPPLLLRPKYRQTWQKQEWGHLKIEANIDKEIG